MLIDNLENSQITNDIIINLTEIYKHIGREKLYSEQLTEENNKLLTLLTIQKDAYYIAKLLQLNITDARLEYICKTNSFKPKNNSEQAVANIKILLLNFIEKCDKIPLYNVDLEGFYHQTFQGVFQTKFNDRTIRTNKITGKQITINNIDNADRLLEVTRDINERKLSYEPVLFSTLAFLDYFDTQLFKNNHLVFSLLFFYIELLKIDVNVFKSVSMFEYIFENYNSFMAKLYNATMYSDTGMVKPLEVQRFLLDMIDNSYNVYEEMVQNHQFDKEQTKVRNIVNTIYKLPPIFQKSDIKSNLPFVSDSTINKTLQSLSLNKIIQPISHGRQARWQKLVTIEEFENMVDTNAKLSEFREK